MARTLAILLTLAAALADVAGAHGLAVTALVLAVPAAALTAMLALGDLLASPDASPVTRLQAVLSGAAVGCLLLAAAVRVPLAPGGDPPAIGASALVACLAVFALQALVAGLGALRPRTLPLQN